MARDFSENNANSNSKNPTHKIVIETKFGTLSVALFTKNNQFHAELVEACEGSALHFLRNEMTSAAIVISAEGVNPNSNSVSAIKAANKAA